MRKIIYCVFFAFVSISIFALDVPPLTKAVNDNADLLVLEQRDELEKYLQDVDKTLELQVALLTVSSLEGEILEDYAMRVVENWKLGSEGSDRGVLLLISKEDRKLRIEVGYGLEENLNGDIRSKIIGDVIAPCFKQNDYYNGIKKGLKAIVAYALNDEELIKEAGISDIEEGDSNTKKSETTTKVNEIATKTVGKKGGSGGKLLWYILIGVGGLFVLGLIRSFFGKKEGGQLSSYSSNTSSSEAGTSSSNSSSSSSDSKLSSNDKPKTSDGFSGKGGDFGGDGTSGGW